MASATRPACVQLSDQTAVENEPQSTYSRKPVSTVDRYSLLSNDIPSDLGTRYYSLHGGIRYFLIESLSVPHLYCTSLRNRQHSPVGVRSGM